MTVPMTTSSCFELEADVSIGPVVCGYVGIINVLNVCSEL